jgi:hypothetical protein
VQYRSAGGASIDRLVLKPGEIPNGAETLRDDKLPEGEWSLQRQGLQPVSNRFAAALTSRATFSWTPKGGSRASFGVWSKRQRLEPGQSVELEADYR